MVLFHWNKRYEIGHAQIDQQHRQLTALINRLDQAVTTNPDQTAGQLLLKELIAYSQYHFDTEEALMNTGVASGFDFSAHRLAHQQFRDHVRAVNQEPLTPERAQALLRYLVEWLIQHILKEDRQLVAQLQPLTANVDNDATRHAEDQLAAALRSSEYRFKTLADCAPAMLWLADPLGQRTDFNQAWSQFTGRHWSSLLGDQWQSLIHPDDRDTYLTTLRRAVTERQPFNIEFRLRDSQSVYRWVHEEVSPRTTTSGEYAGLSGSCLDVTKLKQQQLQQCTINSELQTDVDAKTLALESEKAEQALLIAQLKETQQQLVQSEKMAAIGHLAAGVAHEINNPIGYVRSNVTTLGGYVNKLAALLALYRQAGPALQAHPLYAEISAAEQRIEPDFIVADIADLLAETQEGLEKVKQIIQDLKDFSRVEANDWQSADLCQCLDTTLNVARNEIKYKADIVRDYSPLPPLTCLPNQLCQVFMNLIVNAAQAIEQQGTITLRTRASTDHVTVEIEDTGSGIPDAVISKIFDPFFTTKPVGQGTGLGLSISYGIIQKHRGAMTVTSEVGKGSCFSIRLPLEQPTI